MRCSRTEAPSLRRRYPVSPVLRASPPPSPARPDPHGLSVGACHATGGASRVASIPLFHACRRQYPGGTGRCPRRSLPGPWQPSPYCGRVGFRIRRFEACSAFTRVAARMVAEPPNGDPLSSKCFRRCRCLHRPLRLLPAGATVAGRDSHPLRNGAFARRTTNLTCTLQSRSGASHADGAGRPAPDSRGRHRLADRPAPRETHDSARPEAPGPATFCLRTAVAERGMVLARPPPVTPRIPPRDGLGPSSA